MLALLAVNKVAPGARGHCTPKRSYHKHLVLASVRVCQLAGSCVQPANVSQCLICFSQCHVLIGKQINIQAINNKLTKEADV